MINFQPSTATNRGRATKWAAGSFYSAKLYLPRAQGSPLYKNSSEPHLQMLYKGERQPTDLDSVILFEQHRYYRKWRGRMAPELKLDIVRS
jgi:hypothetical protein